MHLATEMMASIKLWNRDLDCDGSTAFRPREEPSQAPCGLWRKMPERLIGIQSLFQARKFASTGLRYGSLC